MAKTLADSLLSEVFNRTIQAVSKPSVPVPEGAETTVAAEVTKAVKPVITNAVNAEPWYKSRIYWGLIVAAIGVGGSRFGISIPGTEVDGIVTLILQVMEVAGLAFATYGRLVGAKKAPLGE